MALTKQQEEVIKEVKVGKGNIIVQATAGSGKSFTLLKSLNEIPRFKKTIFLSFSKFIVEELKSRVPSHIKACTLHSLGYGFIISRYRGISLAEDKYLKIALKMLPSTKDVKKQKENFKTACYIEEIVRFARLTLTSHKRDDLKEMCLYFSLEYNDEAINHSISILNDIGKVSFTTVDFTDMLYLPVIKPELVNAQYDYVMVDEVQDSSACQLQFLSLIGHKNSRYILVGDEKQSIYGFAGSDVQSFQKAKEKFNCKQFNLSYSFRCSKNIVLFAKGIYDVIDFHESAKDGEVRLGSTQEIKEGDMVLCRNTLPLIHVFFDLIERNIKATIIGKDIESGLIAFAKQVAGYSFESIRENMQMMLTALATELRDLGFKKPENHKKYGALLEKIQVINLILNKIKFPTQLESKIHEIFHEDKKAARLMTIHRAKGGENNRVFIIESYKGKQLIPSEYAVQPWELVQETNVSFVAYTRAKEEMILVEL